MSSKAQKQPSRQRFYNTATPQIDDETTVVYIAGKVSGRVYQEAQEEFDTRADELEKMGYLVLNPMDYVNPFASWQEAMKVCIRLLPLADYIDLLPGWGHSEGAKLEFKLANKLGIKRFGE